MEHNRVAMIYRLIAFTYFDSENDINQLDNKIYNFANEHRIDQYLENEFKKEIKWLKENFPNNFKNKNSNHKIKEEDIAGILLNLSSVIIDSGGKIPDIEYLKTTSAWEFIKLIASNKIKFCHA